MNDFVVHSKLTTTVVDNKNTHATTSVSEAIVKPGPEPSLVDHWKTLLDIAGLGHGDDTAVVTDI